MLLPLIALSTAQAATIDVGSGEGAYLTIGEAISAASSGDTIRVGPGTYPEAIDLAGKAISLQSTEGADTTIVTGNGSSTLNASSGESSTSTIAGFTLQGDGHTCISLNAVSLRITDSIISGCGGGSTFLGGAVQINGGSPRFEDVTFRGNQAVTGGAVRAAFDADIAFDGCRFEENIAEVGGALHLTDATITVTDSAFIQNSASTGNGGAIWADEATLTLTESSLVDNTALFDGGAIFASDSTVYIESMAPITGNEASYGSGGALRIEGGSEPFALSDSLLEDNSAWTLGGAVSIQQKDAVTISGVNFDGNSLRFSGGAGGALAGIDSSIDLSTSTFSENTSAGRGGAILAIECEVDMTGVEFNANEAVGQGGAWYQLLGSSTCTSCDLTRNTSTDDGGAIWSTAQELLLMFTDVTWNESTGGNGGGVFFSGDTLMTVGSRFLRNTALSGGAVFTSAEDQFSSEFCIFQENESIFSGGGLWIGGESGLIVDVRNNDFLGNECLASDGVAQLALDSEGADIRNNIVAFGRTGAGIGVTSGVGGTLLMYNDVFENEGGDYQGIADPTGEDGNLSVDPLLVDLSIDRNFLNDNLYLQADSPLVEAGAPEFTTDDGRRSFIGVFDRIDLEDTDMDGDGFTAILGGDCDDEDPTTYPGAVERCDDEVDNDCDADVNEDCGDTGAGETGSSDTGIIDTGTADTGEPEADPPDATDTPDDDDRTPSTGTPSADAGSSAYKVDGDGCSCSVQNTSSRRGVLWLLTPLLIWVRRR